MKTRLKLRKKSLLMGAAAAVGLMLWTIWGNITPQTTEYRVVDENLPEAFSGFRIAQVSDLHNARIGADNKKLLAMIKEAQPDIIVITGDLIDSRRTDVTTGVSFVKEACRIAPVYYTPGNHESRLAYAVIREELEQAGAVVLNNSCVTLRRQDQQVHLLGLMDPEFKMEPTTVESLNVFSEKLEGYTIVLCHRPKFFEDFVASGVNLAFCGHIHGGQVRIPGIGGLYGPDQGFFPDYDAGIYCEEDTTMVVSRGLGASVVPLRINNRPELIVVQLEQDANG